MVMGYLDLVCTHRDTPTHTHTPNANARWVRALPPVVQLQVDALPELANPRAAPEPPSLVEEEA